MSYLCCSHHIPQHELTLLHNVILTIVAFTIPYPVHNYVVAVELLNSITYIHVPVLNRAVAM